MDIGPGVRATFERGAGHRARAERVSGGLLRQGGNQRPKCPTDDCPTRLIGEWR
ncbi:hypothetical protein [Acidiphilium sp. 20-67-58]|uniref:hypothetical protein n=1 Tax=Acidiphilium sp. 20-67-58 TaxID=1970291 RepID=UPI0025B8D7CF|nr:hypothetical protein [Acidiphilium sp. 20-67-58]